MTHSEYFHSRLAKELHRVSNLTPDERASYLAELKISDETFFDELDEMLRAASRYEESYPRDLRSGDTLGAYTLVEFIGEGGFGQVWRASRPDQPDVAIKVARFAGRHADELQERFKREWKALGRLDHVGVATIRDHGLEPEPFLAMELVDGVGISEYVVAGDVPLKARIDLVVQLCEAIQHAHGKSVLHRDLKPSNVLVTTKGGRAQVKVIDFGIARLVDEAAGALPTQLTAEGDVRGTLSYMSPEQAGWSPSGARPDIDVRTDVFGVGRILFEVLTGEQALPLAHGDAVGFGEALSRLSNEAPASPRARVRSGGDDRWHVPVELDAITQKATARTQSDRYPSVEALMHDLLCWQRDETVSAQAPTAWDLLRRLLRRNAAVLGPAALVLAAFAVIAVVAERGRRAEAVQRRRAEGVLAAQVEHLQSLDVTSMGMALRGKLLEQATRRVGEERALELVEQFDCVSLARSYFEVSYLDGAETAYRAQLAHSPGMLADLLATVTHLRRELGLPASALPAARSVVQLRTTTLGADADSTLEARYELASLLQLAGEYDASVTEHEAVALAWERRLGPDSPGALSARAGVGLVEYRRSDFAAAQLILEDVTARIDGLPGRPEARMSFPWTMLAAVYQATGRHEDALVAYRRAHEVMQASGTASALELAQVDINLGQVLAALAYASGGDEALTAEAVAILAPAARVVLDMLGDEHPSGISALNSLVMIARLTGDSDAMLKASARTLEAMRLTYGRTDPRTLSAQANHVMGLVDNGQLDEGDALALTTIEASQAQEHPNELLEALMVGERGRACALAGRFDAAEPLLLECYERVEALVGRDGVQSVSLRAALLAFYTQWHASDPGLGKDAEATHWGAR